jgi:hypothetical protein
VSLSSPTLLLLLPLLAVNPPTPDRERGRGEPGPAVLTIGELVEASGRGLAPSRRALALAGKAVRLLGYMVHTEEPTLGSFWLASRPVGCDEGGAGTGDLPPDAVRVVLRGNPDDAVPHVEGPLAVTGVLEVGSGADPDVASASLRLVVERRAVLLTQP